MKVWNICVKICNWLIGMLVFVLVIAWKACVKVWGWFIAAGRRGMDKLTRWWQKRSAQAMVCPPLPAESTAYVTIFKVPVTFDPLSVPIDECPGLQYCQVLKNNANTESRLLAVWRDHDAFRAVNRAFLAHMGFTAADCIDWEGLHCGLRQPKPSWKRFLTFANILATVSTVALFFGNIESIIDFFGSHFGPPQIDAPNTRDHKFLFREDSLKFEVPAQNNASVGECSVVYTMTADPEGLELDPPPKGPIHVKHGEQKSLPVSGRALQPGDFVVTVTWKAKSGFLGLRKEFESHHKVKIWQAFEFKPGRIELRDIDAKTKMCQAKFDLFTGSDFPDGLRVTASMARC